ncbi:MAG TPA: NAD(P)H-dependent oxidoreductase subunit E [Methylomirabilota bacterium]|nr:NAD(P)H-dependent oxidoreductase subunit E [Methylomirabilota bacterium]
MAAFADLVARFPRERTWLLPALQAVQHHQRWLSSEALAAVAEHLRVPKSEVWGVATHYPEFRLSRPGKRVVRVCVGVPCRARGALGLLAACERGLGVKAGATAADGSVTLERTDCAFNCAVAPVIEIEGEQHGRVREDDLGPILSAPPHPTLPPYPALSPFGGDSSREGDGSRPSLPAGERAGVRGRTFADLVRAAEDAKPPGAALIVGAGSCGLSVGAGRTLAALRDEVDRRAARVRVIAGGCHGLCWAAPVVTVLAEHGARRIVTHVSPERVRTLLDAVASDRVKEDPAAADYLGAQRRELTGRCGLVDPADIADAIRRGSYAALARALEEGRPERVLEEVRDAGLRGRGGAYFQAAVKWEGARRARGEPKYLIVNGEEGEPGIFKDRHLMEGDPHRLLEGALLAAYAAEASRLIIYVHGEAHLSALRVEQAVAQAREWGLLGERVLGTAFSVEAEVRRGAGGFVLGEETALMESLEGRRAMPRPKPPFPTEAGLWGLPTVINNVETLFAVPLIVAKGAAWWASLGQGHGTKCFGLSGHVARPGLVETELGVTLRDLLERIAGGAAQKSPFKSIVLGGPSGVVVHARHLDEALLPGGPLTPGTGGITALDTTVSVREVVETLLDFNTRESCGKCTPCREGTARLRDILAGRAPGGRPQVEELSDAVKLASLCGLGQAAPLSILSALAEFPGDLGVRS